MRLRIVADASPLSTSCFLLGSNGTSGNRTAGYGQIEDYSIYINAPISIGDLKLNPRDIKTTKLKWKANWKSNPIGFEIQRNFDGSGFHTITFVNANRVGNGSFEYRDESVTTRKSDQYRLNQLNEDGSFEVLETLLTEEINDESQIYVHPNPVTGTHFELTLPGSNSYEIEMSTVSGTIIPIIVKTLDSDLVEISGRSKFSAGLYFLKLSGKGTRIQKFVKLVVL